MELNKMIDHTKLGAVVSKADIDKLIDEAIKYYFKAICINPCWVRYAKKRLANSSVLVCTVIGFPLGANSSEIKKLEAIEAIKDGADEIDMVINIAALKNHDYKYVVDEISSVVNNSSGRVVKVIIETCYLSQEEKIKACNLVVEAKAQFVKTSTGFGTGGATFDDVLLLKETVKDKALVKASGGVRTYQDALLMIQAGATRIGTSNGVTILENKEKENNGNTSY